MWLLTFAPLVSQYVSAHRAIDPADYICSASGTHGDQHHSTPDKAMSACDYCDLLAGHPTVPTPAAALIPVLILLAIVATAQRTRLFVPLGTFPSGRPRGPPLRLLSSAFHSG